MHGATVKYRGFFGALPNRTARPASRNDSSCCYEHAITSSAQNPPKWPPPSLRRRPEIIGAWLVAFFCALYVPAVAMAQETNSPPSDNSPFTALRALLDNPSGQTEFLDPDEAFQLNLESAGEGMLVARFLIAKGYYLYRDKMGYAQAGGNAKLGPYTLPPGLAKQDDYFGNVEIYEDEVNVLLPVSINDLSMRSTATIALVATYQGCAEKGICYPPIEKSFSMVLPAGPTEVTQPTDSTPMTSTRLAAYLAAAFATGLLLSFTPCVLPLIPILSSVIAGQGQAIRRGRTGALSIAYVLGMAATYTAIGAVAGATGEQLQAYFQNVWAIGAVSLVLVLMALSLLGLYTVQMPGFLQSRLVARSDRLAGGTLGMVFALGVVSALVIGACVSPLLISILSIAFLKGNPVLGGALMFSVALGMGVILICIGFGAGFSVSKSRPLDGISPTGVWVYVVGGCDLPAGRHTGCTGAVTLGDPADRRSWLYRVEIIVVAFWPQPPAWQRRCSGPCRVGCAGARRVGWGQTGYSSTGDYRLATKK